MKNILLAIVCMLAMFGCDSTECDKQGRRVAAKKSDCAANVDKFVIIDAGYTYIFTYVVVDGHEYLMCEHDRGVGLSHSPKCTCIQGF